MIATAGDQLGPYRTDLQWGCHRITQPWVLFCRPSAAPAMLETKPRALGLPLLYLQPLMFI